MDAEAPSRCEVCDAKAQQRCAACNKVVYCGREHQKADWKRHKEQCRPYRLCYSSQLGRHLVATRDLKEDELVMKDPPLVIGPSQVTVPICLSCYTPLKEGTSRVCDKCGWPWCGSDTCRSHPAECELTMRGRVTPISVKDFGEINHMYECIMALRCLYFKGKGDGSDWKTVLEMESHEHMRKGTLKQKMDSVNVVGFITNFLKLPGFCREELEHVCGVLDVNSLEIPEKGLRGLYPTACLLEHSCIPNCRKLIDTSNHVIIRTVKSIAKDQHLKINYVDPMWTTPARQTFLQESKYFTCTCERCVDPTELGTFFSCVKCTKSDCKGYLLPPKLPEDDWICNGCEGTVTDEQVRKKLDSIGRELVSLPKGDVQSCENFIFKHSHSLHPNHGYMVDVKQALLQLLGQAPGYELETLSTPKLAKKLQLGNYLLEIVAKIAADCWRLRGMIHWEIHTAIFQQAIKNSQFQKDQLLLLFKEVIHHLQTAKKFLAEEPPTTPESRLKDAIPHQIDFINRKIKTILDN